MIHELSFQFYTKRKYYEHSWYNQSIQFIIFFIYFFYKKLLILFHLTEFNFI